MVVGSDAILYPVAAHLVIILALYAWLTLERFRAVASGERRYRDFQFSGGDAPAAARVSANLSNQFELGPLFHLLALTLWAADMVTPAQFTLACVFVAGRVAHTLVQTLSGNVMLRGLVFSVNFLALAGMWTLFLAGVLL